MHAVLRARLPIAVLPLRGSYTFPEQAMGWFPLDLGPVVEDKPAALSH